MSGLEEGQLSSAVGARDTAGDRDGSDDEKMVIDEEKGNSSSLAVFLMHHW
jgi:hypothetical protein